MNVGTIIAAGMQLVLIRSESLSVIATMVSVAMATVVKVTISIFLYKMVTKYE